MIYDDSLVLMDKIRDLAKETGIDVSELLLMVFLTLKKIKLVY